MILILRPHIINSIINKMRYSETLTLLALFFFLGCSPKTIVSLEDTIETTINTDTDLVIQAIKIDQGTLYGPCEPSIAINPTNPDNIVAGAILDRVYFSDDGGVTWEKDKLRSSYGVYGDPVIQADYQGNFFYAHLSNPNGRAYADTSFLDRIVFQKSTDGGISWSDGSYTLPRSPKDQDKHWLAIDPKTNDIYVTWTEFDLYDSPLEEHRSRILFSRSTDTGEKWTDPVVLSQREGDCLDEDNTTEGAVPCVGPDGQIYVAWAFNEKIYFDKSYDKGKTWLEEDLIVSDQPEGWVIDIPGLSRCNGMPVTAVDRSDSPYKGTIYVNWGDQRNGIDDTDIWIAKSENEGESWSEPIRVNNDVPGKHQFLSWMDVDESTGYIYVVFYDRRAHEDFSTDTYLAVSKDGGTSFENIKINDTSFIPSASVFFGDYNDISVIDGRVRPIWTQLNKGKLSIWTALIDNLD